MPSVPPLSGAGVAAIPSVAPAAPASASAPPAPSPLDVPLAPVPAPAFAKPSLGARRVGLAYWLAQPPSSAAPQAAFASAARALDGGFGHADNVLAAAEAVLKAEGVASEVVTTSEGFEALRIGRAAADLHPLNRLAAGIEKGLDGFTMLYSPAKLAASGSRGVVSASAREIFVSHGTIASLALDPITLHEVHHAYLNLAEERGKAHAFLGSATSFNGKPVSTAASEQGGYAWYMSFQELPAYAIQVQQLGATLTDAAADRTGDALDPVLRDQLGELRDMARWGWALAERTRDVAARILAGFEAHPETATYWLRTTVPAGRDPAKGVPVRWAKIEIPDLAVEIPLTAPDLPDFGAGPLSPAQWQQLGAAARAYLTHLATAAAALSSAFATLESHARTCLDTATATSADLATLTTLSRAVRGTQLHLS